MNQDKKQSSQLESFNPFAILASAMAGGVLAAFLQRLFNRIFSRPHPAHLAEREEIGLAAEYDQRIRDDHPKPLRTGTRTVSDEQYGTNYYSE